MHFHLGQRFDGSLDDVLTALADPSFLAMLGQLPNLAAPELLEQTRSGDLISQRVRYRFTGDVSRAVRAVVDPAKLTWVEVSTIDIAGRESEFHLVPDHYPDRLQAAGHSTFTADGDSTVRTTTGHVTVRVRLVGGRVEQAIVSGLEEHAEQEVAIFRQWRDQRP
jgi:hypothetical protein